MKKDKIQGFLLVSVKLFISQRIEVNTKFRSLITQKRDLYSFLREKERASLIPDRWYKASVIVTKDPIRAISVRIVISTNTTFGYIRKEKDFTTFVDDLTCSLPHYLSF